uniref:NADP-dependent oxidoreductase domain-containing protein n=1 Tax=Alexandrium catenella TaxID=2925 RepID=A0A7S1KWA2_ALECA
MPRSGSRLSLLARHVAGVPSGRSLATACPALELGRTGDRMPAVGLGTWKLSPQDVAATVEEAIKVGYRHIDCACDYGNESLVGQGIRAAIAAGVCSRADLWVTSKLWNTYHREEHVQAACRRTLTDLGLDYLDLYLVHFPIPLKFVPFEMRYPPEWIHDPSAENPRMELDEGVSVDETWGAMECLVDEGLVRNIGVANFRVQLLQHLRRVARIQPQVNQVELHPFLAQDQLVRYCAEVGVAVTGFSPLGAGSYVELNAAAAEDSVLLRPEVKAIAKQHERTPAQVVLRWATQRGYSVVPKSSSVVRLRENLSIFDFELSTEEVAAISHLDCGRRFNDPGVFCVGMGAFYPIFG